MQIRKPSYEPVNIQEETERRWGQKVEEKRRVLKIKEYNESSAGQKPSMMSVCVVCATLCPPRTSAVCCLLPVGQGRAGGRCENNPGPIGLALLTRRRLSKAKQ